MTYFFMGIVLLGMAALVLYGARYDSSKASFLSLEDSVFLRGFWCLVVVITHVTEPYQNRIQDMISSFGFIAVTFFFMTSGFGLKYSLMRKKDYMKGFLVRHLPPLLLPALIAQVLLTLVRSIDGAPFSILAAINISNWVKILVFFYLLFWVIYGILPRFVPEGRWQDVLMCAIVVACSLIDRFTAFKITFIWIVEPLGFAYGIFAANHQKAIEDFMGRKWLPKVLFSLAASGILGILYLKFKTVEIYGDFLLKIILGIAIEYFIFQLLFRFRVGNRASRFLGKISYEVYLIHELAFMILMMADRDSRLNPGLGVLCGIALTVVFAAVFNSLTKIILNKLYKR